MSTTSGDQYPVHVGLWTNWSRGYIMGGTLTLKRQDADLLIAFTALFITFYSVAKAQDVLYHQCQAILRNSSSPESGLFQSLQVVRVNWGSRRVIRPLSVAAAAMLCTAVFTVASGFSSRVSTSVGSEVLIRSSDCGGIMGPIQLGNTSYPPFLAYTAERVNNAANYVQQCYSDSNSTGLLDCQRFVTQKLATSTNRKGACPFHDEICHNNSTNLILDSGFIDSHLHFGQNSPPDERILWRSVLTCAPLKSAQFTSQSSTPENYTLYHYGTVFGGMDYVHTAIPVKAQYSQVMADDTLVSNANYMISAIQARVGNGTYGGSTEFIPIKSLARMDADIDLIFLSGNGVVFLEPMDDGWYRTESTPTKIQARRGKGTGEVELYLPLQPASTLGCITHHQFCNTAIQGPGRCTALASLRDATFTAAPLFNSSYSNLNHRLAETESQARFLHFMDTLRAAGDINGILTIMGSAALLSQRTAIQGIQTRLEPNQWQLDIAHIWNIWMAVAQRTFIDAVYRPIDPKLLAAQYNYTAPELVKLCNSQKIRSAAYGSFSVFWLLFILLVGLLLISISYLLDVASGLIAKKKGYGQYTHLEWISNATLQLQRLAHEGLGMGTWSRCVDDVPATKPGELLGLLDISDLKHPVLYSPENFKDPSSNQPSETPSEDC
ncbi:hypothetical protein NUW58_g3827 [Xylaria curta]|uniref:Uncharacterized protein n=1 Tax=Xylaria curta TaxID=42375 RepID=A0ACC1P962_9PEZI|nr:hypothetical protein NUW58_g3827 [Xylaria curta]